MVGGGIAGITAALEASEAGTEVHLVEKEASLGGRVAQLARYFPKLCPPTCGLEINYQRLRDNPSVHLHTSAQVASVSGSAGSYSVVIKQSPRYVNDRCTTCDACYQVCPVERPDPFNHDMTTTRAIALPHQMAYPPRYVIDEATCLFDECGRCVDACAYQAIDLHEQPSMVELQVGAVVMATGWRPYDASAITNLGFGVAGNVVTNVMFERMAAANGPTGGSILRPSDARPAKRVAFVQCAGSRDRLHLQYCSSICCLASLKQAAMLVEAAPEAEATIYYIDLRTPGTYEAFAAKVLGSGRVHAVKGKVAAIEADPATGDVVVVADDMVSGTMTRTPVDLVVLATGMQANLAGGGAPEGVTVDGEGFVVEEALGGPASGRASSDGIFAAGCARAPVDVQTATLEATAAAMRAMSAARPAGRHPMGVAGS